jgi:hypothetical protein
LRRCWECCAAYDIKGFGEQWNDGKALNALIDAIQRGLLPSLRTLGAMPPFCQSALPHS